MTTRLFYKPVLQSAYYKLLFILLLTGLCTGILRVLYPLYGDVAAILIAVPVLAAAGMLGLRVGLIAWAVALPVESLLLQSDVATGLNMIPLESIFGFGMLLIAVIAVGRSYDALRTTRQALVDCQTSQNNVYFNQQITDTLPDLVYIFDLSESRNVYTNRSVASMLGYSSDDILQMGSSIESMLTHPDDLADVQRDTTRRSAALKGGGTIDSEYRMKTAAGDWHWLHSRETVFAWNPDGSPRQVIGIAQDITERRQDVQSWVEREKLETSLEKERELVQLKNQLMITISHEFRTPLSVILASGELLERYFDRLSPARRTECLSTIKTQILHLREMLDEITTMMGEEGYKPVFRPSPMNLEAVFKTVVEEMQASVGSTYTLAFTAGGDLNPIPADENLLRPILRNLLSNAVKYSRTGDTVQIHLNREDDGVVFTVSDNGIGIPTDEQSRIFDTLHRASNVSHIGGLGIGLRIVRDCVALHGGTVAVQSAEGKGTTFTVRLPLTHSQMN